MFVIISMSSAIRSPLSVARSRERAASTMTPYVNTMQGQYLLSLHTTTLTSQLCGRAIISQGQRRSNQAMIDRSKVQVEVDYGWAATELRLNNYDNRPDPGE